MSLECLMGLVVLLGLAVARAADTASPPATAPAGPAASAAPAAVVNLPERIGPADLAARLMDLPDTIEVVDIRPAWQYAEYHIQAAANATPAAVLSGAAYLEGKRPLVLVCRDGFVSAAVGGALAQKSQRPIKVLDGGMARYYDEVVRPKGIVSDRPTGGAPPAASPAPVAPPATQSPTPAAPQAPAKKRAGC